MTIFEKILYSLISLAVSCIVLFSVVATWWLVYPYNVVDIKTPITVLTKQVVAGKMCELEITYSKYLDIYGKRQIQLKNGMVVPLDNEPIYVHLEKGLNIKYRVGFVVPNWYPAGYCHAEVTTIHQVNPLRIIVEKFDTEEFEVVSK